MASKNKFQQVLWISWKPGSLIYLLETGVGKANLKEIIKQLQEKRYEHW